jgi:hypothetical protein
MNVSAQPLGQPPAPAMRPSEADVPCGTLTPPAPPVEITAKNLEAVLATAGCHGKDFPSTRGKPEHLTELKDYGPAAAIDFPHADVFANLDGEPPLQSADSTTISRDAFVEFVRELFDWLTDKREPDERTLKSTGTRAYAAAWTINPERFGGVAGRHVALEIGLKNHQKFSAYCAEFSRNFGIRNCFQVHDAKNRIGKGGIHANSQN